MKIYIVISTDGYEIQKFIGAYKDKKQAENMPKVDEDDAENWIVELELEE